MNKIDQLYVLRTMVGEDDSDDVLDTYLSVAGQKIIDKAFPYNPEVTEVPERYRMKQCEIAAYLMNKRGAEGELSHKEGDITRSYADADVPASFLRGIIPTVGVIK